MLGLAIIWTSGGWLCMAALSIRALGRRLFTAPAVASTECIDLQVLERSNDNLSQNIHFISQTDLPESNKQLKELVKTGHLGNARRMFDKMSQKDEISWTTLISGYVNANDSSEALLLFKNMRVESGLRIDPFILSLAHKACGLNSDVNYGELLHGYAVKTGLVNSVFVGSALLDMYTKNGKIFEGGAGILFGNVEIRVEYDSYTFAIALKACADSGALNYGREIHAQAMKKGFDVSSFVANTLATMYNKCGKLEYGLTLFEKMSMRDVVSWTTIITTLVQMGQEECAVQAFIRMRESDVSPNEYTFAAVISGCANLARIEWGEQLHALILHLGLAASLSVENSIMTMYAKCGQLTSSSVIFHEMTRRDIVSWSTIIAGYSQGGHVSEAFELLSWMRMEGPKPTEFALASVLSACGNMAILEHGKQLHAYVLSIGLEHTAMVLSALINMYCKCGSIEEASRIFDAAENDDIVSWTAMINGYAEHGYSREVIDLFEKIPRVGLRPDSVTFIGVLSACSHAGLVDLGFRYFNAMSKKYQISPSKEHYGCMIDLLCRAGRLSDAEHMIEAMPFHRDDVVWSTLLRACRVHGDVERGRRTAERILQLEPNCAGTHITLANIYASKGKWREAADIRKLMKSKGVIKEPGWSWIKVKDLVFAFVAGDRSHPQEDGLVGLLSCCASSLFVGIVLAWRTTACKQLKCSDVIFRDEIWQSDSLKSALIYEVSGVGDTYTKEEMLCSIIWASSILLALCDSGAVNIRIMVQQFYCGESRNLLRCSGSGDDFQEETYPFRVLRRQGPSAVRCQPNQEASWSGDYRITTGSPWEVKFICWKMRRTCMEIVWSV
ncbi:putative pentatricopeptide repeat-containing protein [Vitis vinifera]|uniref:Putative pentatricopeptide repeat-containing protein n=1 Tax=Vitis vinifera TaxID=29760 RepID=A0A438BR99_VITVI|nr:putative pentatricopeptide repeat-containing protein [Vitis vinifera]